MLARDAMTGPVISVTAATAIGDAAAILGGYGLRTLPVVDIDNRLVGVVAEVDLVRAELSQDETAQQARRAYQERTPFAVSGVMTSPGPAVSADTDIVSVVDRMLHADLHSVAVVEGARLVGMVTRRDLVRAIGSRDAAVAEDIGRRLVSHRGSGRRTAAGDGHVEVTEAVADATDNQVAAVLAELVLGASDVTVSADGLPSRP